MGNDVYFQLNSDTIGMSDGTANGTVAISVPSSAGSVDALTSLGNTLLIQTLNESGGPDYQLWAISQPGASPTMIQEFGSVEPLCAGRHRGQRVSVGR